MEDLKIIHDKLLKMLIKFHSICEENNLKYYMIGGTQLGAVRHKGFIPWDDDIDIGMPSEDYNKFINLSSDKIPSDLAICHYKNMANYPYGFCKLYDKTTTLVEDNFTKQGIIGGIYIDVFRLDGIGNTLEKSIKNYKSIDIMHRILYYNTSIKKTKNPIKKLANIFFRLMKTKKIINSIDKKLSKYEWDKNNYVVNAYGAWRFREIMRKDIFGTPTLYDFEGYKFFGVEKYDEYLTNLYGDYMKLPPEEKRKSHHNYKYLNLNLPYEQYKGVENE